MPRPSSQAESCNRVELWVRRATEWQIVIERARASLKFSSFIYPFLQMLKRIWYRWPGSKRRSWRICSFDVF